MINYHTAITRAKMEHTEVMSDHPNSEHMKTLDNIEWLLNLLITKNISRKWLQSTKNASQYNVIVGNKNRLTKSEYVFLKQNLL